MLHPAYYPYPYIGYTPSLYGAGAEAFNMNLNISPPRQQMQTSPRSPSAQRQTQQGYSAKYSPSKQSPTKGSHSGHSSKSQQKHHSPVKSSHSSPLGGSTASSMASGFGLKSPVDTLAGYQSKSSSGGVRSHESASHKGAQSSGKTTAQTSPGVLDLSTGSRTTLASASSMISPSGSSAQKRLAMGSPSGSERQPKVMARDSGSHRKDTVDPDEVLARSRAYLKSLGIPVPESLNPSPLPVATTTSPLSGSSSRHGIASKLSQSMKTGQGQQVKTSVEKALMALKAQKRGPWGSSSASASANTSTSTTPSVSSQDRPTTLQPGAAKRPVSFLKSPVTGPSQSTPFSSPRTPHPTPTSTIVIGDSTTPGSQSSRGGATSSSPGMTPPPRVPLRRPAVTSSTIHRSPDVIVISSSMESDED